MSKIDLDTLRHSCSHLMAQAITRLFNGSELQLGIGPTTEDGFYYDVLTPHKFTEEDLRNIENKMKEIIKENLPIVRKVLPKKEAIAFCEHEKQYLKVELINSLPDDIEISFYTQGEFTDLCRGPHVEKTGQIPPFFKLLHTAGAYFRGDETRPMLQRIYATCFNSKDKLNEHLTFLEEAKKRDHRKLGKELGLFIFDTVAPASPFFMPKGAFIYNQLIQYIRNLYEVYNYKEVITPQILDSQLWHTSGHYEHYKENMYFTNIDKREFAVKPMNCPCHMLMFKHHQYSYRDLPLRFADFGRLHRYERSGAISGLTRVRSFCQDDSHIFLPLNEIQNEIKSLLEMFFTCYKQFGFKNVKVFLSTRPEKKAGDDKTWDIAEESLAQALKSAGFEYTVNEGDGAFYGPKIDILVGDALNRYHQLGTIQLDFQLPDRFDLRFTNQNGEMERPVVIHRALLGSLERFMAVYIEHVAGAFPFWIAPEQVVIIPVKNDLHLSYCQDIYNQFRKAGIRAVLDDRNETLGLKTRNTQTQKIPFMLVVGDKELQNNSVSARKYGEKESKSYTIPEILQLFTELSGEINPKK
ncbi:MAG: threonine--tRNA ligase [Bacteriovoracaceae bacterium]